MLSEPAADADYGLGTKRSALATIEVGAYDREAAVRDALRGTLASAAVADLSSWNPAATRCGWICPSASSNVAQNRGLALLAIRLVCMVSRSSTEEA